MVIPARDAWRYALANKLEMAAAQVRAADLAPAAKRIAEALEELKAFISGGRARPQDDANE